MARLPIDLMTVGDRQDLPSASYQVERARAVDFGAAEFGALGGIADAGLQLAKVMKANETKLKGFNNETLFLRLQEQDNTEYQQAQQKIPGDGTGFTDTQRAATEARFKTWLDTLNPADRAEYAPRVQAFLAARVKGALTDQFAHQHRNTQQTIDEQVKLAGQQVVQAPQQFEQIASNVERVIQAAPLNDVQKRALITKTRNDLAALAGQTDAKNRPQLFMTRPGNPISPEDGGPTAIPPVAPAAPASPRARVPSFSAPVNSAIDTAAQRYGLDPAMLRTFARIESSGNPGPESDTGKYKGLFQISEAEFRKLGGTDIYDPVQNADVAAKKLAAEAVAFKNAVGRDATPFDLYMVHQQGIAGYPAHLANPNAPAWQNMLSTGEGQQKGPNWSKMAIWKNVPDDLKRKFGSVENVTSQQFVDMWRDKFQRLGGQVDGPAGTPNPGPMQRPDYYKFLTPQQQLALDEAARQQVTANREAEQTRATQIRKQAQDRVKVAVEEGTSPETVFRQALTDGTFTSYDERHQLRQIYEQRVKRDGDTALGTEMFRIGAGNPLASESRDAADAWFKAQVKSGVDPVVAGKAFYDRTAVVPPTFATALRGALAANDPQRVAGALVAANEMLRGRPNAFAGVDGRDDVEQQTTKFRFLTETQGLSTEQAVQQMMTEARDPQRKNPVKDAEVAEFRKTQLTDTVVRSRLASKFGSWLGAGPLYAALPPGEHGTAIVGVYGDFAAEGFRRFRDTGQAMEWADQQMRKTFGVQNGVIMQYPPAKSPLPALPGARDPHAWVNEQATTYARQYLNRPDIDASQVFVVPISNQWASTAATIRSGQPVTVTRRDSKPGQETTFNSVPYQIMVVPKTPDQVFAPVQGVFYPDIDQYVADTNAARRQAIDAAPTDVPGVGAPQGVLRTPAEVERETRQRVRETTDTRRREAQELVNTHAAEIERLRAGAAALPEGDPRRAVAEARIDALTALIRRERR